VSVVIVGVIRRKPVLTHASIVCEGMLASVNSVNNNNIIIYHRPTCFVGTGTFPAQDLSFPRTNSPYGELSFPGTFVPGPFRSLELSFRGKVPGTFVSVERKSSIGNFRSWERKVLGAKSLLFFLFTSVSDVMFIFN